MGIERHGARRISRAVGSANSSSFLKKRTKKLLTVARRRRAKQVGQVPPETDKSFLVLFFKKELLFLPLP
jgi:hypothetical protein